MFNSPHPNAPAIRRGHRRPALLLMLLALFSLASSSFAATLTVTNTNDSGPGSLRGTLAAAAAGDTVTFDAGVFSPGHNVLISLTGGRLIINKSLAVQGPGTGGVTISDSNDGIFSVTGTNTANITVRMSGLTFANGNGASATSNGNGGAIFAVSAALTLTDCAFRSNAASVGGAISSSAGTLSLTNCALSGNTAGVGGAISSSGSRVALTNCTLFGNRTSVGGVGGGIYSNGSPLTLTNCTVVGNIADGTQGSPGQGGGIYNGGTATVQSSIINGNAAASGPDIFGSFTSGGSNLIGDPNGAAHGFTGPHDMVYVDPRLDPNGLKDNGGPTQTVGLLPGSPAIGGDYNNLTTTDQRGLPRPLGTRGDIGAFQLVAQSHILWNNPDGRAVLWYVNSDGSHGDYGQYGPYTDGGGLWKAAALATGPSGVSRILWNNPDGRAVLWYVNPDGSHGDYGQYGPYTDGGGTWRATALSVGPDNAAHILWTNPDGRSVLWYVNPDGTHGDYGQYGPYTDGGGTWRATALATGPSGVSRILWTNPDGRAVLWYVNPDGFHGDYGQYGPYTGGGLWGAKAISVGPDNVSHILWTNPDGRAVLWYVNPDGFHGDYGQYGPYTGGGLWAATALSTGP